MALDRQKVGRKG